MDNTLFVYHKDKKIKVLNEEDANASHENLIKDGWKHTSTINPCVWIENLFNNSEDLNDDVLGLVRK